MIGTLDELLVVSDIDNTLLNAVEGLPEVNRATVQLFSSMGGRFTVATGRTVESVRRYLGDVAISAPVIALGGAVIYDFAQEQYIQNITLNKESAMAALREVQQNFPGYPPGVEQGAVCRAAGIDARRCGMGRGHRIPGHLFCFNKRYVFRSYAAGGVKRSCAQDAL